MSMSEVDDLLDELLAVGAVSNGHFVGCTPAQVGQLIRDQGVSALPPSYQRFLDRAGFDAGPVFAGSDVTYARLLGMKRDSEELLVKKSANWSLKTSDFVIQMHQGYQIFWIDTSVPESEVWKFTEGDKGPIARFAGFVDYLKSGSPLEQHHQNIRIL